MIDLSNKSRKHMAPKILSTSLKTLIFVLNQNDFTYLSGTGRLTHGNGNCAQPKVRFLSYPYHIPRYMWLILVYKVFTNIYRAH
jgi:hypothetical protein